MTEREKPGDYYIQMLGRQTRHDRQAEQDFVAGIVEEEQDRDFNIFLPYSDFTAEWVNEDENLSKASSAFPLWRLSGVSCLGFLINIGADENFDNNFVEPFNHTRVNHSLVVARLMEKILRRNKVSEQDINIAGAAGTLHDIATPGGGDAVKTVDNKNLDEEDFWWEVIDEKGWKYLDGIGATKEQIDDIVHNKGLLGKVLDVSDRITYVMQDLGGFMSNGVWAPVDAPGLRGYNMELQKLLYQDSAIGDIYKTVRIEKELDQVYFSDPEKLRKFLEIRAILHKDIYLNWASQGRDMLVAELLRPYYSETPLEGKITPHDLRRMSDEQLLNFLSQQYGVDKWGDGFNLRRYLEKFRPSVETFPTLTEAKEREEELRKNKRLVVLGTKHVRPFNAGTSYLVMDEHGDIVPFKKHDPVCAQRLDGIAASTENNFVFYEEASKNFPRPHKI